MKPAELQTLGFTLAEAKIYLTLLEDGPQQAGKISKITHINRRTTYDTLERLINKGYINYNITANKRIFKATNPELIIEKIEEMKKDAEQKIPELKKLHKKNKKEHEANIYEGRKGVRNILHEILKEKEYVVFGSNEKFPHLMQHDFTRFQEEKKRRKTKSRTIMSIDMRNKSILKKAYTKFRFIPQKFSLPTSTFIYGDKVATIIWSETPIGTVVENKEVAKSFKEYFEALWSTAK